MLFEIRGIMNRTALLQPGASPRDGGETPTRETHPLISNAHFS